tara:strand:- start:4371 stop:4721 length:351 start_codon:yes stop_codon:yes gene_type:complete
MKRVFADLFAVPPQTWGARGEPYLWEDIRQHAIDNDIQLPDSIEKLPVLVHSVFNNLTLHTVNEREWFFVEKYAHGGMSSGHIDPSGWRDGGTILDYIHQSFIRIKMIEQQCHRGE